MKVNSIMKKSSGMSLICVVAMLCVCLQSNGVNAQTEKKERRSSRSLTREDSKLLKVFESLTGSTVESTVKVQAGNRQIAVGTIVDTNGLVLTKASEMRGDLKCRLPNGDLIPASVFGIDVENDLALLKIEAEGLAAAPLNPVAPPTRGNWLVSPTDQNGSLIVGVVGVDERKIPPSRAFIGIQMLDEEDDGGVLITEVLENTPAKEARLREDDIIVKLDDLQIRNRSALVEAIGKYTPGSEIALTVKRKEKEMVVKLVLADAKVTSPMNSRSRTQNNMGSRLSRRGTNFPRAFQHDMALNAKECGGPVVNLDGQIVGINIARSGRVSSLAIPIDVVLSVIEKLKSGELSPVKVYADRIQSSEEELAEMKAKLANNRKTVAESEQEAEDSQAKIEELERMKLEITKRIKEVYEERDKLKKTRRVEESKAGEVERAIRRIESKLEALRAGKKY
jgi:serine protease Do